MISAVLKTWLPLAATVTLLCGVMYIIVQQSYRSNANDPQIQMAEEAAFDLSRGADPKSLPTGSTIEISRSLRPFLIVYDEQGKGVTGDGVLDGKIPTLPAGVLDFTRTHSEDAITWQPRSGVRSALVINYVPKGPFQGFVVAGRSLREAELRESMLTKQVTLGWILSLALLLVFIILLQMIFNKF